jgi:lipid II:glycine glycyltransferase (peptidoglycan interpeptide bridge formation enzyme)
MFIEKDGFQFKKSNYKYRMYDVFKDNCYICSFGDIRYEHYFDKIGMFRNLSHNDLKRKERFYQRYGPNIFIVRHDRPLYFLINYLY